jgi:hypothetical protein
MDVREIGRDSVNWMDLAQDTDRWRALVDVSKSGSQPSELLHDVVLQILTSVSEEPPSCNY